ncbi:hypothetical protein ACL6C3_19600 [Capilliphycus salinus ALCB114379]|uniref:hypothetical protein n=1 Tax=Capilliphycus salinus TaxID=2768948 RepID=UPI0039A46A40
MSEPNSRENPLFQVNEKMYQQLLKWQQKLEQTQPETPTSQKYHLTQLEPQKNTNQNDH